MLTTEVLQLIQAIGWAAAVIVLLVVVVVMFALILRSLATRATKESGAVTHIALDSTEEAFKKSDQLAEVYKQIGDVRQELGRSQGQAIVLMDNLKTVEQKREASEALLKDQIFVLKRTSDEQTVTISRHEGRIVELEKETKQQAEIIESKEKTIISLSNANTLLRTQVETLTTENTELRKDIQLMTRAQRFGDTVPLSDAELSQLDNPAPKTETPATPTPETNEEERKIA